jgi:3-methylcrotonyl-CoA carboxylase alpha subunit
VQTGDAITIHYDPMIAKISVHAPTRTEAIRRMQSALADTIILGTTTNLAFLQALIQHPVFINGEVDTSFVDRHVTDLLPENGNLPAAALIVAALHDSHTINTKGTAVPVDSTDPWARADGFRLGQ